MIAAREKFDPRVGLPQVGFKGQWQLPIGIHLSKSGSGIEISEQQEESECHTKAPSQLHHNILSINILSAKVSWTSGKGIDTSRHRRRSLSVHREPQTCFVQC